MMMPEYEYGVQWIDDGGPFDYYTTIEDLEEVFEKIDPSIQVLNDGGVTLIDGTTHYYIKTNKEIPYWPICRVSEAMHRYSSGPGLWLYTFSLTDQNVKEIHTHDEYIEIMEF